MAIRSIAFACVLGGVPLLSPASAQPAAVPRAASASANLAAYRTYASEQAEMLVRMTGILAEEIAAGNLQAAQNDYAMTHKYLERIRPAAQALDPGLDARLDGTLAESPSRASDLDATGFHRIEYGLFAARSTHRLAPAADRLLEDARQLRTDISTWPMPADALLDRAAGWMTAVSLRLPAEGLEPYARTDLWDLEANLDGAQEIVAAMRPQIETRDPLSMARISSAFTRARERLSQFEEGCGYKPFDALTRADKMRLGETVTALARELSKLRVGSAID